MTEHEIEQTLIDRLKGLKYGMTGEDGAEPGGFTP